MTAAPFTVHGACKGHSEPSFPNPCVHELADSSSRVNARVHQGRGLAERAGAPSAALWALAGLTGIQESHPHPPSGWRGFQLVIREGIAPRATFPG